MQISDLRLNMLVQGVTMLSVLAGVGFVIWELQQQRELLRLEMFSEGTITNREIFMSGAGENPAIVLAKACEGSESLTTEDLMVLNFYYNETIETINRMRLLENGLYPVDAWESNLLEGRFSFIFSTAAGRAWWESFGIDSDVREPIDAYLASLGPPNCAEYFGNWKSRAVEIEQNWK